MNDLILSAPRPLLDGWSGPILDLKGELGSSVLRWLDGDAGSVCWDATGSIEPVAVFRIGLDLARSECRDRVSRWAAPLIPKADVTKPRVRCYWTERAGSREMVGVQWLGLRWCAGGGWVDWGSGLSSDRIVPGLAELDPEDPRVLADGCRWVDAAGMLLVAREVTQP